MNPQAYLDAAAHVRRMAAEGTTSATDADRDIEQLMADYHAEQRAIEADHAA